MTAIGAIFAILGWVILKIEEITTELPQWLCLFGFSSFFVGLSLGWVGVVIKLWEVMP